MEAYTLSALITIFTSIFTFYLAFNVGATRRKTKSSALDNKQDKQVIVSNRVHMNMIEASIVFIPLLWIATLYTSATIAGSIGAIWFASRVWYSAVYLKNPDARAIPFIIGVVCTAIVSLVAFYGILT